MTFTANTSALLYGSPLQRTLRNRKRSQPTPVGTKTWCPPAWLSMCLRTLVRTGCVEEKSAVPNCFGLSSDSSCRIISLRSGHEYDEATPTSDLWDAVLAPGQQSKHCSTAVVPSSLTSLNSPNGAPTAGGTTDRLYLHIPL